MIPNWQIVARHAQAARRSLHRPGSLRYLGAEATGEGQLVSRLQLELQAPLAPPPLRPQLHLLCTYCT